MFESSKKINISNNVLPTIIVSVTCLLSLCSAFEWGATNVIYLSRMLIGVISIFFVFKSYGETSIRYFIYPFIIYTYWGLIAYIYNQNADLKELLWPIAFWGFALLLLFSDISLRFVKITVTALLVVIAIQYVKCIDNPLFFNVNSLGVTVLFFNCILVITAFKNNQYDFWVVLIPFISLCIGVFSIGETSGGRSSTIIFAFIFVANLIFYIIKNVNHYYIFIKLYVGLLVLLGAYVLICIYGIPSIFLQQKDFLLERGMRSTRFFIWKDYVSIVSENLGNLLLGAKLYGQTYFLALYQENLHNSFLMLHAKYTIFMMLVIIVICIRIFVFLFSEKEYPLLICFMAIFMKMNVDYTNFNSVLDTILVFYILLFLQNLHMHRRIKSNDKTKSL